MDRMAQSPFHMPALFRNLLVLVLVATGTIVFFASSGTRFNSGHAQLGGPLPAWRHARPSHGRTQRGGPSPASRRPPSRSVLPLPDPKIVVSKIGGPIQSNTETVCSPEVMDLLATTMASDLEHLGLSPLTVASPLTNDHHFNGFNPTLLHRAFLNKRVAIAGDSTLREFSRQLGSLLHQEFTSGPGTGRKSLPSMDNMALSTATEQFVANITRDKNLTEFYTPFGVDDDDSNGALLYLRASRAQRGAKLLPPVIKFRPTVMLVNFGLHMLHLWNYGRDKDTIADWIRYEEILAKTVRAADKAGAELLLLKTTNFVCHDVFYGDWVEAGKKYAANDRETLDRCFASVREKSPAAVKMSNEDVAAYCRDAPMIDDGSRKLNERLYRFVDGINDGSAGWSSRLRVAVFNDHDLQSCETTTRGDGRHHKCLNLARMRLLGNYIDCMQSPGIEVVP